MDHGRAAPSHLPPRLSPSPERHSLGGISFDPPAGWLDRTVIAFTSPAESTKPLAPSIVITREPVRPGDSLRLHGSRQLMELEAQLTHFHLMESRDATLGGYPALFFRFAWESNVGAIEQTMTLAESTVDGVPVMTTVTTTAAASDGPSADALFTQTLATLRFDDAPREVPRISTIAPAPSYVPQEMFPSIPMPGSGRRR